MSLKHMRGYAISHRFFFQRCQGGVAHRAAREGRVWVQMQVVDDLPELGIQFQAFD